MNGIRRLCALLLAAILLLSGPAVQSVSADTSATVSVTASVGIVPFLEVSVCDDTASFGTGLTNEGAAPAGADPGVFATMPGSEEGQGVFYIWQATCFPGIHFDGNVVGSFHACGTENAGPTASPDLKLEFADLLLQTLTVSPPLEYHEWNMNSVFITPCPLTNEGGQFLGPSDYPLAIGLRVDDEDAPGDLSSVVTFSVEPA